MQSNGCPQAKIKEGEGSIQRQTQHHGHRPRVDQQILLSAQLGKDGPGQFVRFDCGGTVAVRGRGIPTEELLLVDPAVVGIEIGFGISQALFSHRSNQACMLLAFKEIGWDYANSTRFQNDGYQCGGISLLYCGVSYSKAKEETIGSVLMEPGGLNKT